MQSISWKIKFETLISLKLLLNLLQKMSKTACVILAVGIEEIEVFIILSILRRAGMKVTTAGLLGDSLIKCKNHLLIMTDTSLETVKNVGNKNKHFLYFFTKKINFRMSLT